MKVIIRFLKEDGTCKNEQSEILEEQVLLSEWLRERNVVAVYDCGGKGLCGKCKVRVVEGAMKPTAQEKKYFSDEELQQGYRLACQTRIIKDCMLEIQEERKKIQTLAVEKNEEDKQVKPQGTDYGVAIDLGTTTIAFALVSLTDGNVIGTWTMENAQRQYGADVMSRIEASNRGAKEKLQILVRDDLKEGMAGLCDKMSVKKTNIKKVVIAANTTMSHLLLGYSCQRLGKAPFVPVSLEQKTWQEEGMEVVLFPGVSAFIGGDIISGLSYLDFSMEKKPNLLLDLGTNAEMVLWTGEHFLATSAAAGPALEGGNISNGCPSIPGAICDVMVAGNRHQIKTIGNVPATGICGSGLVSAVSGLLHNHIIDEQGTYLKPRQDECDSNRNQDGFVLAKGLRMGEKKVVLTQEDIRNYQLAKSAVFCGMRYLLLNITDEEERRNIKVSLAGGMGVHLPIPAAVDTGLLPKEFMGRCVLQGNTSLLGAIAYLKNPEKQKACIQKVCTQIQVLPLQEWEGFEEEYVKNLTLKKKSFLH